MARTAVKVSAASVLTLLLTALGLFSRVGGEPILAIDQDVYVLITVRNGTSLAEFKELLQYYLEIQAGCDECMPPISNLPSDVFFGQFEEDLRRNLNTTAALLQLMNSTFFESKLFPSAVSNNTDLVCADRVVNSSGVPFTESNCLDIEWQLGYVAASIKESNFDPSQFIRKKQIAIVTNYFYPEVDSLLSGTVYGGFKTTYVSWFVLDAALVPNGFGQGNFPTQVFAKSNLNSDKTHELFLNQYIDLSTDSYLPTVSIFLELQSSNLNAGLALMDRIYDRGLCRLGSWSMYYETDLLIYYPDYQVELRMPVPNLEGFTTTYLREVLRFQTDNRSDITLLCTENFYTRLGDRIMSNAEQEWFNFYVTDSYPSCMVKHLLQVGAYADSFSNHLEVLIHSPGNSSTIDKQLVFDKVTSKLIPPPNATEKANHVSIVDITNETQIAFLGLCSNVSAGVHLMSAVQIEDLPKPSAWPTIAAIVFGYIVISAIVILALHKFSRLQHFKRFFRRRATHVSNPSTLRIGSKLVHAADIVTDVAIEGPLKCMQWRIHPRHLQIDFQDVLGKGSSSTVFRAQLNGEAPLAKVEKRFETQHYRQCQVAVKVPLVHAGIDRECLENEVRVLTQLGWHPNLCAFLGWSTARDGICLAFEVVDSDLLQWARSFRDTEAPPPLKDTLAIAWQVANGMTLLAQNKLCHRDLAARNVLLTSDLRVKIADFGLCCAVDQTDTYMGSLTKKLPIKWLSLEALLDRMFSEKSDVWAFGVMLVEVASCGITPYATLSNEELLQFLREGKRLIPPPGTSACLAKLMASCWHELPHERPSFADLRARLGELLEHETHHYGYLTGLLPERSPGVDSGNPDFAFDFGCSASSDPQNGGLAPAGPTA